MDKKVRIGCASAFWGDTDTAAPQLVNYGEIDYLVFDYLAEVTMSILASAKQRNENLGYAIDFIKHIGPLLSAIKDKNIKVISNAGGVNLNACREALLEEAKEQDLNFQIAIVEGDNILHKEGDLRSIPVKEIETNDFLPENVLSVNAYLGAPSIKKALELGADIIITGRCVDTAVVLGPLMYEFDWKITDYDLLASGSLAGHIIECGAQCTGGNFTDWELINNFENMGFPIVEVLSNGDFLVVKPNATGGLINSGTVSEQFLYEIGDPGAYLLPDVVCDFTQVTIEDRGEDCVFISGARGLPPTNTYKVSATYTDGYKIVATIVIGGAKAVKKANVIGEAILEKTRLIFNEKGLSDYTETNIGVLGSEAIYGSDSEDYINTREVVLRLVATHQNKSALIVLSREIAQAATGMAPGVMNYLGGRPSISSSVKLFSFLLSKDYFDVSVNIDKNKVPVSIINNLQTQIYKGADHAVLGKNLNERLDKETKLINLAYVRSGDKGDHANIGVIARKPDFLRYIKHSLTIERLQNHFSHVLNGSIHCWEVPGINGLNFLLENSLGGGGMASLNIDPQGKAYAQQIIDFKIAVPEFIYNEVHKK
ncbi:MAG: terpene utilization protein AtuA [bacterium TMED217]|nr:MAG: terpene utilization protein AtuA [bacterium TMED217]